MGENDRMKRRSPQLPPLSRPLALLLLSAAACAPAPHGEKGSAPDSVNAPAAAAESAEAISWEDRVAAWKQIRHDRLERPDGWLTLVGLSWLREGENRVGVGTELEVPLPASSSPALLGRIVVAGDRATFFTAPGVEVTSGGVPVQEIVLVSDREGNPTPLVHGSLTLTAIERAGRLAVRTRDSASETLRNFQGLDYYPLDPTWRIAGRFEPAAEVVEVAVPNAVGYDEMIRAPGHVVFEVDGQEIRLLALDDTGDGRLFLVFGDTTNGTETYGGGRFLYADEPVAGRVEIDFNRSYNPPCVFTPYATCPLPPKGNRLPVAVRAGEKKYALEVAHAEPAPSGHG